MALIEIKDLAQYGLRPELPDDTQSDDRNQPVRVIGKSIRFSPKDMELNKFYTAQLSDDEVYFYRRVSEGEVEIYGLAD